MNDYIIKMFPQASISTRTDIAVSKPPVFHSESRRKVQRQIQNKHKSGNFLKGQRKNVSISKYFSNVQKCPEQFRIFCIPPALIALHNRCFHILLI